jgi:hypothetical protein
VLVLLLNRLVCDLVMSADVLLLWRCGEDAVAVRARCKRDALSLTQVLAVRKEEKKSCEEVGVVVVVNRSSWW